jgi:hypothetical protein
VALADGVSPILNLFHKDTWLPATLVTILIILVETALLRSRIKQVTFLGTLWRCTVLNIASSITGSFLLVYLGRDSFFIWDTTSLVFPLFVITLITEIPFLRLLYKNLSLGWGRAFLLGLGINIASYAVVFVAEIALLIGWLFYTGHLDEKERTEWVHPELLTQSSGFLYTTEPASKETCRLRALDTTTGRWHSYSNCPPIDNSKWDVERHTCAFIDSSKDSKNASIIIASMPDFLPIREISLSSLKSPQQDKDSGWQGLVDMALSPDANKLAVLFRVAEAVAYKDEASYYMLGSKCLLAVFDVASGRQIMRASRWASDDGLCWFPDSDALLFSSYKDESVYKTTKAEVRGIVGHGIGYARNGQFDSGLFSLNILSGEIRPFANGRQPSLSIGTRQFVVQEDNNIRLVDLKGTTKSSLEISNLAYSTPALSPTGKLLITNLRKNHPLMGGERLTVIDLDHPDVRHIIEDKNSYRYKWTTTGDDVSAKTIHPLP